MILSAELHLSTETTADTISEPSAEPRHAAWPLAARRGAAKCASVAMACLGLNEVGRCQMGVYDLGSQGEAPAAHKASGAHRIASYAPCRLAAHWPRAAYRAQGGPLARSLSHKPPSASLVRRHRPVLFQLSDQLRMLRQNRQQAHQRRSRDSVARFQLR